MSVVSVAYQLKLRWARRWVPPPPKKWRHKKSGISSFRKKLARYSRRCKQQRQEREPPHTSGGSPRSARSWM
jgi:hypothetical protein